MYYKDDYLLHQAFIYQFIRNTCFLSQAFLTPQKKWQKQSTCRNALFSSVSINSFMSCFLQKFNFASQIHSLLSSKGLLFNVFLPLFFVFFLVLVSCINMSLSDRIFAKIMVDIRGDVFQTRDSANVTPPHLSCQVG